MDVFFGGWFEGYGFCSRFGLFGVIVGLVLEKFGNYVGVSDDEL